MKKKIAVISGWYNFGGNKGISEDYRFMTNCFYESAKKYFLPHHDVEFIFMNNSDVKIEGVTNINFNYEIDNFWHMCLMKILSLKYLENKYDYIFVNDNDQIFIKDIGDEIIDSDFTFLDHYFSPPVKGIHEEITDIVELNFNTSEEKWTMGNFFGGKEKNMLELLTLTEENHKKYFGNNYNQSHFYSRYPEELFIIKYVFENNINHKRLNCCFNPLDTTSEVFLGDFSVKESDHFKIKNTKLLHGTKQNLNKLKDYMIENKKIVIAQFFTTNLSYGKFTEEINKKYCDEKGYIYHLETDDNKIKTALEGRSPTWYKPKFINEVFELYNPDYILFLDADAIVCDFTYSVEEFIEDGFNIICTEDYGPSRLNAGVFLMKNSDWTKRVMNKWWETGNNLVGGPNNEMGFYKTGLWHDQTCFGHLMDIMPDSKTNIKLITNKVLNGREYKNNVDKNFIFHAFSYGMLPNRTIDKCYYDIFNLEIPDGEKLSDIVEYYDTDKHYEHNYLRLIYDDLFLPIRDEVKTFVEIGVNHGGSILMWRDYFKNSKVLGLDNNLPFCEERLGNENLDRIELINLDQSIPKMLDTFANQYSDIDVILEDGSHRMYDQQITLGKLFKTLKSGGIYVLEDLHTSLEAPMPEKAWCGWGDSTKTLTLDMLKNFISTGKIQSDYLTEDEINYLNDNILSVEIYQNRPDWSITSVIIKK